MTDYSKYTVVKLKEELKARSLPQTGLKAVLIARLSEAVSSAESPDVPDVVDSTENESENNAQLPESKINAPVVNGVPHPGSSARNDEHSERAVEDSKDPDAPERLQTPSLQVANEEEKVIVEEKALTETSPQNLPIRDTSHSPDAEESRPPLENTEVPALRANVAAIAPAEASISSTDGPNASPNPTQTSLNREEVLEDSKKRKRRSQSPPPSTFDIALKKAKAIDGSPRVRLPEDESAEKDLQHATIREAGSGLSGSANGELSADVPMQSFEEKASITSKEEKIESLPKGEPGSKEISSTEEPEKAADTQSDNLQSPTKISSSDTRFRNLFSTSNHTDQPPAKEIYPDIEDRDISPAIHPATSALYIRNFMRPLQPNLLRNHLAALANRSNQSPSLDVVTNFFVDSIKSHCLVRFASVSAAARVRTALHDRVWPDEKTRKPLFIDYVPEEKLAKWIEVEQSGSGGRQQAMKRWEVVYQQEDGGISAYLQEADGNGPSRPSISAAPAIQKVPTVPKTTDVKPPMAPVPKGDPGKGFKALDDLFRSTVAKPKLYFQPVPDAISSRRLDKLAAGRGGGRSDEMRRFTFEDDSIVDKGPEFGSGWRGGARGRGAYSGWSGGRGGGGGYRGGRGDNWR